MRYGLIKSGLDAHTLGLTSLKELLQECGYKAYIGEAVHSEAIDNLADPRCFVIFKTWILDNKITHLGFSYRLDPGQALERFEMLLVQIEKDKDLSPGQGGCIKNIYFAGLPDSCRRVRNQFGKRFLTFEGDETPVEVLKMLGIPDQRIPRTILENSVYDDLRLAFGKDLIDREMYAVVRPAQKYQYEAYGTARDHLIDRLNQARKKCQLPLMRVHVGPYLEDREGALALFSEWLKALSRSGYLDIVSVGSSQLSQSHFGEDWGDKPNGGGVPFNSEFELRAIQEDAMPMLVRAYSATKNVKRIAQILEENLNMAWHALSLWWFNQIDGRGPLTVREGLSEQIETLRYIAERGKPYEPNLPHHFAFRGCDDVTYVVSAYLAAKLAKQMGIRYLVLQNMLNTPRSAWGVRDLVKSRVMLKLVRRLEDGHFMVIYQPRAGLDYFSPKVDKAKMQLAAVTALMQDVEPDKQDSPEIIHVVSYSEALFLASPEVIDESIQITRAALKFYPEYRENNAVRDIILNQELRTQTEELWKEASLMIKYIEKNVRELYSSQGFYDVFKQGYFPVPYLWEKRDEFARAVNWKTKIINGGVFVVDDMGKKMDVSKRLERIQSQNS